MFYYEDLVITNAAYFSELLCVMEPSSHSLDGKLMRSSNGHIKPRTQYI